MSTYWIFIDCVLSEFYFEGVYDQLEGMEVVLEC